MIELLRTKLFIPRSRKNLVSRPHLIARLNAGLDKKLTLIAAPAGFGKTTLLSEWIPQSPRCVTWFSLDESENDPVRFWAYLITSLQTLRPDIGESALALLQSLQPPPITSTLTVLINDITLFPDEFATVLDDYHLIESQAIHEGLAFLIDHLPGNMHIVITTRNDPPLPLARMRARNSLTEIRAHDLRFTVDETGSFLNNELGRNLTPEEVAIMEARTEGWIAGLQIAVLSMRGHDDFSGFIQTLSGNHRHILGYLADEVLDQRPKGTLNFLLQTSILDRLCGPLCDAVTDGIGGQAILENLAHANLFITPLDDNGRWYRYHHLFAEVLHLRIRQIEPDLIPILHARAREWFEQNGLIHEAVNHAIAGGDYEQAARLVEQQLSVKWQSGEIRTLQSWLAAIPVSAWRSHPRLWLVQAWVAMTVGVFDTGLANMAAAEEALSLLEAGASDSLHAELLAFRASHASMVNAPGAIELTQRALRDLPGDHWMYDMLVVFLSAAHYLAGDLDAALDALTKATDSDSPIPGAYPHRIHLLALTGIVYHAKGKLREALKFLYRAMDLADVGGVPVPFAGTLLAYMSLGPVLYERGQIKQAMISLDRCLEMAIDFGSAEVQVYTLSLIACISLVNNNLPDALKHYERIDALLQGHTFSSSIMAYVEYRRFLLYLKQGNLDAALIWVDGTADQSGPLNPYAFYRVALPQVLIAQGRFDQANEILIALIEDARATGHGSLHVKALALQALAAYLGGLHSEAFHILGNVLTLAEPEGFIYSFIEEGEPMRRLLLDFKTALKTQINDGIDGASARLLTYTEMLLAAFTQPALNRTSNQHALPEPLSARELDILRLIATGRSNQEIADTLVIALSTVKSHINNLYGKLGTNRRTQAILIARENGLLSE